MSYSGEERRMEKRRDDDGHCLFHKESQLRIKQIEQLLPKMQQKISIGVGVVISAAVVATILFGSLNAFKEEAVASQVKHEQEIRAEQVELKKQINTIEAKVNGVMTEVAVVSAQLKDLRDELKEDRKELRLYLRSIKSELE